jgi:hypothetical protein
MIWKDFEMKKQYIDFLLQFLFIVIPFNRLQKSLVW